MYVFKPQYIGRALVGIEYFSICNAGSYQADERIVIKVAVECFFGLKFDFQFFVALNFALELSVDDLNALRAFLDKLFQIIAVAGQL